MNKDEALLGVAFLMCEAVLQIALILIGGMPRGKYKERQFDAAKSIQTSLQVLYNEVYGGEDE